MAGCSGINAISMICDSGLDRLAIETASCRIFDASDSDIAKRPSSYSKGEPPDTSMIAYSRLKIEQVKRLLKVHTAGDHSAISPGNRA